MSISQDEAFRIYQSIQIKSRSIMLKGSKIFWLYATKQQAKDPKFSLTQTFIADLKNLELTKNISKNDIIDI